jgi:hypothetical protein
MKKSTEFPKMLITFSPAWWNHHYGIDFGEDLWIDVVHSTESACERNRLLFKRFGDVGLGEEDPQPQPQSASTYGDRFMSAFWGCEIRYLSDQPPAAIALPNPLQQMERIRVPDIASSPVVEQAFKDAARLKQMYGKVQSGINFGAPLNNAVSVFGEEILAACVEDPELAGWVLRQMAEAILAVYDQVSSVIDEPSGDPRQEFFGLGNCPVCMIRPRTYAQVVLPVDLWLREQFKGRFQLHHCGIFHPYAEVYQPIKPTELDLGWGTDLRVARKAFPDIPMSTYIDVSALRGIDRDGVDAIVSKIIRDSGPLELLSAIEVAEIGPDVPDETVRNLMTAFERIDD